MSLSSGVIAASGNWNVGKTGYTLTTQDWNTVVPDAAGVVATALGNLETHGDSTWATATGFATPTNITAGTITTVTTLTGHTPQTADNNTILANATYGLAALKTHGDSDWITATSTTVSDKTGFKLASDGLDLVTAWTTDITGAVSGNSTHSAANVKTAIEAAGSHLTLILEDTGTTIPALLLDVGTGTGAIEHDITVLDADTHQLSDVELWVYTDTAMTNLVASGITNAFGVATFYLDAGTYFVKSQKSGYNFTNPSTEVVTT